MISVSTTQFVLLFALVLCAVATAMWLGWVLRGIQEKGNATGPTWSPSEIQNFNEMWKALRHARAQWVIEPKGAAQIEQLRVQLASCLTAAEGWSNENPPKEGDYAWSPAFQAVMELRRNYDSLRSLGVGIQDDRKLQNVFQAKAGQVIESPKIWDQRLKQYGGPETIPYEELEGMFLDQFLLRYFYSLMPLGFPPIYFEAGSPWEAFAHANQWAKETPLLFEQMTGYALNEIQLNNVIAEWARRCTRPPVPVAGVSQETS